MTYADFNITIPSGRTTGNIKTICPECSHNRKKQNQTNKCLSVNLDDGVWNCHNCGHAGALHQKQYSLPVFENKTPLSQSSVDWFLSRNINQDTLNEMQITEAIEFMPQVNEKRTAICFNYFRDGRLVNIKYRDSEKNFKLVKGAELIFYNLDGIKSQDTVYIVEGEIDALTMIQAGHKNTVSVPNGASKGSNNLQYLDNCYKYFEGIKKVYILTDNDEPGNALGKELARRIGIEKCLRVDLNPYKDINDAYSQRASISDLIAKAEPYPIEGVTSVSDHWDDLLEYIKNGFPQGWKPRGKIGESIQFHPGYTTIITGIPGHGKSELLDQMLMQISLDNNLRGAYFSPENRPAPLHIAKLIEKLLGKNIRKVSEAELRLVKEFLSKRIFWVYPDDNSTIDSILEGVRQTILRHGINWYVIDPWNRIEHKYAGDSETRYISETLDKIANFNQKNGVHCFIVAHPVKMKFNHDRNAYEVPGLYDIAGSANFFNKADIGITVYKEKTDDPNVYKSTMYIQKVKFKHWGSVGQVGLSWNPENGRFDDLGIDLTDWVTYRESTEELPF